MLGWYSQSCLQSMWVMHPDQNEYSSVPNAYIFFHMFTPPGFHISCFSLYSKCTEVWFWKSHILTFVCWSGVLVCHIGVNGSFEQKINILCQQQALNTITKVPTELVISCICWHNHFMFVLSKIFLFSQLFVFTIYNLSQFHWPIELCFLSFNALQFGYVPLSQCYSQCGAINTVCLGSHSQCFYYKHFCVVNIHSHILCVPYINCRFIFDQLFVVCPFMLCLSIPQLCFCRYLFLFPSTIGFCMCWFHSPTLEHAIHITQITCDLVFLLQFIVLNFS